MSETIRAEETPILVVTAAIYPVEKQQCEGDDELHSTLDGEYQRRVDDAVTSREAKKPLDAIILSNVLTQEECKSLIDGAERCRYSFWNLESKRTEFRNAETVEVTSQSIAEALWQRLKRHVVKRIMIEEGHPLHERGLDGEWEACGINDHLLFNKYTSLGHFSPHTDGATVKDFNRRSFYSVLVYLNDCDEGGETSLFCAPHSASLSYFSMDDKNRYRWPKEWVCDIAPCVQGSVLIFRQDQVHEGAPVGVGAQKLIIRTDVMYGRTKKRCDDENGIRAYELHSEAQKEETKGNLERTIALLKQCRKVSPEYSDFVRI